MVSREAQSENATIRDQPPIHLGLQISDDEIDELLEKGLRESIRVSKAEESP